jgi:large repetitive protein
VPGSGLGTDFAISGDGSTVLVGGDHDNNDAGGLWVFAVTATAPDAPTDAVATAGDGEATVSFTPPASDGGAPVLAYTVTASPGGQTAIDVGSPITVNGLTDGTAYTFTVTATNSAGTSVASAPSAPVTPVSVFDGGGGGGAGGGGCCPTPDLALTIAAPSQVAAGNQATFTATVSDSDGTVAFDTQLVVTLPTGATVDTVSSDRGLNCVAGATATTVDCPLNFLGTLNPANSILVAHVTIVLTLPTPGAATLSATVSDVEGDRNNANNTASATVQVTAPPPTTTTTTSPPKPKPVAKKAAATVAIVGVQTVQLGKKPKLHVTLKVSKTTTIVLTLVGPKGRIVARWTVHLTSGTKHLALALPAKARHKGRDTLRVRIGTGKPKTTHVLLRP